MAKAEQSHPRPPMPMVACSHCGWFASADLAESLLRGAEHRRCPTCGEGSLERVRGFRGAEVDALGLVLAAVLVGLVLVGLGVVVGVVLGGGL